MLPVAPPLEGLECSRGAPPLEAFLGKRGWVAFTAWGAHSQKLSAEGSIYTLRMLLGAGIGGVTGGDRQGLAKISSSLVSLVVKSREQRFGGCVGDPAGGGSCGI